ncbi:MAG: hypothetical protein DME04_01590 [Candidatus Rokuibacteriota bacterium]|nr:MAG: hypothetical protein DME04_01590 [Candidatus Rokubacteria bacterium]
MDPAPVAIILRQSPDWGRLDDTFLAQTDAFDRLIGRPPGFTRGNIELWNATFLVSFFETRSFLKELCLRNLRLVRGAEIYAGPLPAGGQASVFLFVDDDDWFRPDVAGHLLPHADEVDGLTWWSIRYDGGVAVRSDADGFCFTNNYAVTRRAIREVGFSLDRFFQHGHANAAFQSPGFCPAHLKLALSATIKHPASTVALEQSLAHGMTRDTLVASVESFVERAQRHRFDRDTDWMAKPAGEITDFFRRVLRHLR